MLLLAELGSVQRTARAIGMTQSSVTRTLAVLEALFEVKLFDRHARGVRPAATCAGLLPIARQLTERIADSADVIVAQRGCDGGVIRMLGSLAAVRGLLVDVLPDFVDRHAHINTEFRAAEGEDQLLAITRGEVDLVSQALLVGRIDGRVLVYPSTSVGPSGAALAPACNRMLLPAQGMFSRPQPSNWPPP